MIARALPFALGLIAAALPGRASAQIGSDRYAAILIDATSGEVLESVNADAPRHPASLAKLMTLYLTFEALRDRRIALDQLVPVSDHAADMEPTKLGLLPGTRITVEQAILGLVTRSANDAAAALGEMLGGTEERFAQLMTLRARAIGMTHSTFMNASGLPDPDAWTSARDMALLARRLITDFPGYYHYFSEPRFVFRGQVIFNHDNLLKLYPGADGLKTGYTIASGHNLVTSAARGGHRLIGVELGCASNAERDAHMVAMLNAGFQQEGVPVNDRPAPMTVASHSHMGHFPSLIASAHAAEAERHGLRMRPVAHLHPASGTQWAVQVGSFGSARAAHAAARKAHAELEAGVAHVERVVVHGRPAWRAQITGLSEGEASAACTTLARHGRPCAVLRAEARQVAEL